VDGCYRASKGASGGILLMWARMVVEKRSLLLHVHLEM
jgi:hypothetical protein